MKKKCSTWNKIKTRFFRVAVCVIYSLSLVFVPVGTALAAPAVVPVSGNLIYELLVALGLLVSTESGEYVWKGNDNPYVDSIFESQVKTITSGIPIDNTMISEVEEKVLPKDLYTYDGSVFYCGGVPVSVSDIYLNSSSVVGFNYSMPTNIDGGRHVVNLSGSEGRPCRFVCTSPIPEAGLDYYFVPYYVTPTATFIYSNAISFTSKSSSIAYNMVRGNIGTYNFSRYGLQTYLYFPANLLAVDYQTWSVPDIVPNGQAVSYYFGNESFVRVGGSGDYSLSSVTSAMLLRTVGRPSLTLAGDKDSLGLSVVKVAPADDDDDDNSTPPVPVPPNNWELWRSVEDLLKFISSGEITNGNTDFGQYVNNNYNYVQINVPDEISQNINIGGNLGINGKGDLNININEDISLPSAGDGSGFYNPSAVNVVGALAKDNPIISVVSGLFSAIDPALVGVFSVSVSLLLVLGLWKLIRG